MAYSALDVASYLVKRANEPSYNCTDFTPLKLQKILYFAQGWYLANYGEPLFKERILAWRYGPVAREVYNHYRDREVGHILNTDMPGDPENIRPNDQEYLNDIWNEYGSKTAFELVGLTHVTDPWDAAFKDPTNDEMDIASIREYFTARLTS